MVQNEQSGFEVPDETRELLYESSSTDESAELRGDIEAAEATLLKFQRHGCEAFERSDREKPPEECLTAAEYPLLAELWDNDADSVYDELQPRVRCPRKDNVL